jgi:hypothetical protein
MAYQIIYPVKDYNIPPTLVVNSDQTCVHLILIVIERTWDFKGSKHIQVLEVEDK